MLVTVVIKRSIASRIRCPSMKAGTLVERGNLSGSRSKCCRGGSKGVNENLYWKRSVGHGTDFCPEHQNFGIPEHENNGTPEHPEHQNTTIVIAIRYFSLSHHSKPALPISVIPSLNPFKWNNSTPSTIRDQNMVILLRNILSHFLSN